MLQTNSTIGVCLLALTCIITRTGAQGIVALPRTLWFSMVSVFLFRLVLDNERYCIHPTCGLHLHNDGARQTVRPLRNRPGHADHLRRLRAGRNWNGGSPTRCNRQYCGSRRFECQLNCANWQRDGDGHSNGCSRCSSRLKFQFSLCWINTTHARGWCQLARGECFPLQRQSRDRQRSCCMEFLGRFYPRSRCNGKR